MDKFERFFNQVESELVQMLNSTPDDRNGEDYNEGAMDALRFALYVIRNNRLRYIDGHDD